MSEVVVNLEECKWYEWDDLKKLGKLPDDLDIVQRGCIALVRAISGNEGNVAALLPTHIFSIERLNELPTILNEFEKKVTTASDEGEIIYNFMTEEEKGRTVDFFTSLFEGED